MPGQAVADAQDLLDHLDRLQGADHAGGGAEHAALGAGRDQVRRRLGREQAAIAGMRRTEMRLVGRELALETLHRGADQGLAEAQAGGVHGIAGGEVVGAVGDQIVGLDHAGGVVRVDLQVVAVDHASRG